MGNHVSWASRLDYVGDLLSTEWGVIGAAFLTALLIFSLMRAGRWLVLCLLLFSSMFSFSGGRPAAMMLAPLIAPLSHLRYSAEVLTVILLGFLTVPALFVRTGKMRTTMLGASVVFWVLEIFYCARVYGSIEVSRTLASVVIYTVLVLVFARGLPSWLRTVDDVYPVIRCMGFAAVLFVGCTVLQLLVNPAAVIFGGRLFAVTSNPQYAAMVLAISLLPVVFLVASPHENWILRLFWGAMAGMVITLLVWTGSRTGALMGLIGLGVLFRTRIGRLLGTGVVVAVFVFAFLAVFQVSSESAFRLVSTLDTRSAAWAILFNEFKSSPLIGVATESEFGVVENSYLTVAGRTGLLGFSILLVVLWLIGSSLRRLNRLRAAVQLAEFAMMADLVAAGILSILIGAFFEGILVGTLTFMLLALYLFLGLLTFLLDANTLETIRSEAIPADPDESWLPAAGDDTDDQVPDPLLGMHGRSF
jgi:hypothetical protein